MNYITESTKNRSIQDELILSRLNRNQREIERLDKEMLKIQKKMADIEIIRTNEDNFFMVMFPIMMVAAIIAYVLK